MRLSTLADLTEDTYSHPDHEDPRDLLRSLAEELGYKKPSLWRWWDDDNRHDSYRDTLAAIALFAQAINSERTSHDYSVTYNAIHDGVYSKLRDTEEMVKSFRRLEQLGGQHLPSLVGLADKLQAVETQLELARESLKMVQEIWHLLTSINQAATTTVKGGEDPDTTKWRASIARAGLRKLGINPKADEGV